MCLGDALGWGGARSAGLLTLRWRCAGRVLQVQRREIETLRAEVRDANAKRTAAAQEAAGLMERLSGAERRVSELEAVRLELHQQVRGPGSALGGRWPGLACRPWQARPGHASCPAAGAAGGSVPRAGAGGARRRAPPPVQRNAAAATPCL
jgi:hypothetical protein